VSPQRLLRRLLRSHPDSRGTPRRIDLSPHAHKGGVLFHRQIKIGPGENGNHVAGSQQLIIW